MSLTTSLPIEDKLARDLLPIADPLKTWAGNGNGRPCHGCNLPISATKIEHEWTSQTGARCVFTLHAATWRALIGK